jgi:hypothetical protein
MASWYYAQNGQTLGPVDDDGVRSLVSSGTLGNDAPLMPVGGSTWGTVGQFAAQLGLPGASPFGAPGAAPSYNPPGTGGLPPSPSFGAPSPGFGAPVGGYTGAPREGAEAGKRLVAGLIDFVIVAIVNFVLTLPFDSLVLRLLIGLVVFGAYVGVLNAVATTAGKAAMGLKLAASRSAVLRSSTWGLRSVSSQASSSG